MYNEAPMSRKIIYILIGTVYISVRSFWIMHEHVTIQKPLPEAQKQLVNRDWAAKKTSNKRKPAAKEALTKQFIKEPPAPKKFNASNSSALKKSALTNYQAGMKPMLKNLYLLLKSLAITF